MQCPYDSSELVDLGFVENQDTLGLYIAETFECPTCGYRLERNPVYIGTDDAGLSYQVVE